MVHHSDGRGHLGVDGHRFDGRSRPEMSQFFHQVVNFLLRVEGTVVDGDSFEMTKRKIETSIFDLSKKMVIGLRGRERWNASSSGPNFSPLKDEPIRERGSLEARRLESICDRSRS